MAGQDKCRSTRDRAAAPSELQNAASEVSLSRALPNSAGFPEETKRAASLGLLAQALQPLFEELQPQAIEFPAMLG